MMGFAVLLTLGLVEGVLRVVAPTGPTTVWPPHLQMTYPPDQGVMPGVRDTSRFTINSWGLRGPEFGAEDDLRVLILGGSTAECLFLDDSEAWPHLFGEALQETHPQRTVWVGSAGRAGHTARHHVLQAERLPPQYPRIDAAVVLVGLNDLLARLRGHDGWRPWTEESADYERRLLANAFTRRPDADADELFIKRTELWRTIRRVRQAMAVRRTSALQADGGEFMVNLREDRAERTATLDSMPDLSRALADYRSTLERLVDTLRAQQIEPVLLSQPTIWGDVTPYEESLLWFGRQGPVQEEGNAYYSAQALDRGMTAYNQVLFEVCAEHDLACVDLASQLPRDTTVFYDDAHFNESGSRAVAEVLTAEFLEAFALEPEGPGLRRRPSANPVNPS